MLHTDKQTNRQTDKQTNKQINAGKNIYLLAQVNNPPNGGFLPHGKFKYLRFG